MLLEARGEGATASGDGEFRAPPGTGPLRVRAPEVPEAARFASSCLSALIRRGPPAPGVHRAGIFALFPLPGGRPRHFAPELAPAATEELEGSMSSGAWKQKWHWRKEVKCRRSRGGSIQGGVSGVDASNLSAGIKASAQRSAVKRRAIMMV
jgi:hypothetical protein